MRRILRPLVVVFASLLLAGPATPAPATPGPVGTAGRGAHNPHPVEDASQLGPVIYEGKGFDTCVAPSLATMKAWKESPYRAVGVYIGGRARACPDQPNLTADWVNSVTDMGWRLLPLYVGSQAPCVHSDRKRRFALDPDRARQQGMSEGRDAVRQAQQLGMDAGSAIYFDMEAYNWRDSACADATLTFVRAWNRQVRELGYVPGFYSSADSGVRHMEQARLAGESDLPEAMWFARWDNRASVTGEPALASDAWQPHRRIHQYRGNVTETHGGRTLTIDRNLVDAPVAVVR